jgi:FkbM family methyltransferase
MKILNWLSFQKEKLEFLIKYPNVPIINMRKVGSLYSQDGQDLYLAGLIFGKHKFRSGTIVDIGCNHPTKFSNSYAFERYFNCSVIGIDALGEYKSEWETVRPSAQFIETALSDEIGELSLFVPDKTGHIDDMFSSIGKISPKVKSANVKERRVPVTTLTSVLRGLGVKSILLLSIDVEGAELKVLSGIQFSEIDIKFIVLENNEESSFGSDSIRNFLNEKGFDFHARIGCLDDVFVNQNVSMQ